jgi:hypothetical protein
VLAWGVLVVIVVGLALLVQTIAARALGRPALTAACLSAVAGGNDVRESFLAHACG